MLGPDDNVMLGLDPGIYLLSRHFLNNSIQVIASSRARCEEPLSIPK
jgi:hypothetical protein